MADRFKTGDIVYIISSGDQVEKAKVLKVTGGFYTLRFAKGGGTKLRESRLFATREEALHKLKNGNTFRSSRPQSPVRKEPVKNINGQANVQPKEKDDDPLRFDQIIIHVDMDAFYASVEARDDPSLKGKPLIIGALPNERGVVATCSYEARKYGIHSAMNIKDAYRLCPHGIFMHGDHEKYKRVSDQLHQIWNTYAARSEYLALDEAYLDVTETAGSFAQACEFARLIKKRTKEELGLTCSIGVAYSKTAAKTASEEKKPDGFFVIETAKDFMDLVSDRDVQVLYTVGAKTAEKLHAAGINTVKDIRKQPDKVAALLGKQGRWLNRLAFGIDDSKVTPYRPEDARSISREFTFQENVADLGLLKDVLLLLSISVEERAKRHGLFGKGVTLKITYADMRSITRSKVIETTRSATVIYEHAVGLLEKIPLKMIRLIGVGIHNLSPVEGNRQLSLEETLTQEEKQTDINDLLRPLAERYGLDMSDPEKIFHGKDLYDLIEDMRKERKRQASRNRQR